MRVNMDDGSDIAVDMGPLIDCVFLLLIFFLVSSTMKKPEMEIKVDLPEPAISAQANADREPAVIAIDKAGQFYMKGVPVGQSELHRKLKEFAAADVETHIRIDVDRESPSRCLVQLLDLCAFEGLKNYALHTRSEEPMTFK
jgi:biopolymer transport protein ExbD